MQNACRGREGSKKAKKLHAHFMYGHNLPQVRTAEIASTKRVITTTTIKKEAQIAVFCFLFVELPMGFVEFAA